MDEICISKEVKLKLQCAQVSRHGCAGGEYPRAAAAPVAAARLLAEQVGR